MASIPHEDENIGVTITTMIGSPLTSKLARATHDGTIKIILFILLDL